MSETQNTINEIRTYIESRPHTEFIVSPIGVQTVAYGVYASDMDLDTLRFYDEDDDTSDLWVTMIDGREMCLEV